MDGDGRRSLSPRVGGGGAIDPPASLLPTSARKLSDEDNPFLRQLHLMLGKPSSSRAMEAGCTRVSLVPSAATVESSAEDEWDEWNIWPSVAQPKTVADRVGRVMLPQRQPSNQERWQLPSPLVDINDLDSSSDDDDNGNDEDKGNGKSGTFRDSKVVAKSPPPPSMAVAEAKSDWGRGCSRRRSSGSDEDEQGEASPGPDSDGGWPETKRCPPPNLNLMKGSREKVDGGKRDRGGRASSRRSRNKQERRGMKDAPPPSLSTRTGAASQGRGSITSGRAYLGGGITEVGGKDGRRCSLSQAKVRTGSLEGVGESPASISANTPGTTGGGGGGGGISGDDDWMSDAEEIGPPPVTPPGSCIGKPKARDKRKRERTSRVRSPAAHCSDGGWNSSGSSSGKGRGEKTGRSERYRVLVPRRSRSSSLSLTPPLRSAVFNSDYDSNENSAGDEVSAGGKARGGERAKGKEKQRVEGSGSSKLRKLSLTSRNQRGRKRGPEELLDVKDRIEAMRVGSDGEGLTGGGASGSGDQQFMEGRRYRSRQGGGRGDIENHEEDLDDDEFDAEEDLKPSIENPTWLGPLEAFDLGDGGFINPSINRYLKGYQREGVKWMYAKYKAGEGGVLGDDMGLGKTVQSVALVSAVLEKTGTARDSEELKRRRKEGLPASATELPWLIVAPASVARVWMEHLDTWGYFSTFHLESGKDVDYLSASLSTGRFEVVVTSYDLLRMHGSRLKKETCFDAVLFDEYHTIKSSGARVSLAALELRKKRVFGLTGTIIQNDMKELWFLTHLIDPISVGEQARFTEHFSEPIKRARAMNASAAARRLGDKRLKELNAIRSKNMIRRTKEEVLSDVLKGKSDTVVFCDLSEVQRDLYLRTLELPEFQLLKRANEPCGCGRKGAPRRASCCHKIPFDEQGDGIDPRAVLFRKFHPTGQECPKCPFCCQLAAVSKLQKIANHPCLLQENLLDSDQKRREQRIFAEVVFTEKAKETMGGLECSQKFLTASRVDTCGKMASLEVLLDRFSLSRAKVLVFSWSTAMLDVLESFVTSKGYAYRRLDGSTPPKERQARIREFNSDRHGVFVFLISTRAGGQGLNLHTASRVVLYDVNWNPAHELQAQDRAYRIGQKSKVAVFRLISKGTIEEMCYMRQIYKLQITSAAMGDQARGGRRQFTAVQGSKGQEGELFGIQNLLKFSDDSLLKALRRKYAAQTAGAAMTKGEESGAPAGVVRDDGDTKGNLSPEDVVVVNDSGSRSVKKIGGRELGGAKVDAADEAELMSAVREAVGRAQEETKDGAPAGGRPEDTELAGLLGVLGLDAYTHDQLVAKDEGEEELPEEASAPAIELPSLPLVEAWNYPARCATTPRGFDRQGRATGATKDGGVSNGIGGSGSRGGGVPGGVIDRTYRVTKTRPGTVAPLKRKRLMGFSNASASPDAVVGVDGDEDSGQGATVSSISSPPPPPDSSKTRRNLDWGKSKIKGAGAAACSEAVERFNLFLPAYGKKSCQDGGVGGEDEEAR